MVRSHHKVRVYIKSSTVHVPSSELGLSQPLSRQRVAPPPRRGGGHTRQGERGWGSLNSDDWRMLSTLPIPCGVHISYKGEYEEPEKLNSVLFGGIECVGYSLANVAHL